MTPEELRDAGEALFGPRWQTPLAAALDVQLRTLQRWASGDRRVPPGLAQDLAGLCRDRGAVLKVLAGRLSSPAPHD